jgi:hypothetical protein
VRRAPDPRVAGLIVGAAPDEVREEADGFGKPVGAAVETTASEPELSWWGRPGGVVLVPRDRSAVRRCALACPANVWTPWRTIRFVRGNCSLAE